MSEINAKEYIVSKRVTRYDEKKHLGLLYDVFSVGKDAAAFCSRALISRRTFYHWLNKYAEFKEAFEIVINMAEDYWRELPLKDSTINHQYWYMIMKNCFGYGKPRFVVNDGQGHTPIEIINAIFKSLKNGELSVQEASQLASLALTQANIQENTPNKDNSIRQLSTEELKERLEVVNKLIAIDEAKQHG